jgi:dTDP-4-amino-4,6-dideoxygalactose transaminase
MTTVVTGKRVPAVAGGSPIRQERGVHLHPLFRGRYGYRPGMFPHATRISERTISIPLSPSLSDRDVDDVIEAVQQMLTHFAR